MIKKKDVIRMRVPFPNIDSGLAVRSHMYICLESGNEMKFIKCQTLKPMHKVAHRPPFCFVEEEPNIERNPFTNTTLIDCDKAFCAKGITVDTSLLTSKRRDVSEGLFTEITNEIKHANFTHEIIDSNDLTQLNAKINLPISQVSQ